jgi:hypothetical protein
MNTLAPTSGRWTPMGVAAVVLGFVAWWPLGLAALVYIALGGSIDRLAGTVMSKMRRKGVKAPYGMYGSSGNAAFDAYRAETLERLEREQEEFRAYVQKLRDARDSEEFRRFMEERAKTVTPAA